VSTAVDEIRGGGLEIAADARFASTCLGYIRLEPLSARWSAVFSSRLIDTCNPFSMHPGGEYRAVMYSIGGQTRRSNLSMAIPRSGGFEAGDRLLLTAHDASTERSVVSFAIVPPRPY
jgi:hypothetical protein